MQDRRRNWTDFEDRAIITLVKKHGTKNWAEISEKMSSKYGIQQRTGKQCRERWHNHLDPDVNKQEWTDKQQQAMFQAHQQQGNHWTQIAKQFPGRTDNDVKNHFYSMLRRSLRRVNKLLGLRNSTKKVRLIKPSVLSKFFAQTSQQTNPKQWKKISEALFECSKSKSIDLGDLKGDDRKRLQDLIEAIAQYNQEYELNQLTKKNSKISSKKSSQQDDKIEKQKGMVNKQVIKQHHHQSQQQNDSENESSQSISKKNVKKKKQKPISKIVKPQKSKVVTQKIPRAVRSTKKAQQTIQQVKNILKVQPHNLRSRQSQMSFKLDEEFNFNQLIQLPDLSQSDRRRSSGLDSRRVSSSNSSNFYLNSSPKMDMRIFARTPTGPTPNLGDMLTRGSSFCQWPANQQAFEDRFAQIKRQIERKTNYR